MKKVIVGVFGRNVVDFETGEILGRALVFFWRGRLLLLGYQGPPLQVEFVAEVPFEYSRRVVGFRKAIVPDFPRTRIPASDMPALHDND
jgi:hypothetical protein